MLLVEEQQVVRLVRDEVFRGGDRAVVFVVLQAVFRVAIYSENLSSLEMLTE